MSVDLARLCRRAGCEPEVARELLAQAAAAPNALPWYARVSIGLAAWITALVAVALGIAVLYAGLAIDPLRGVPLAVTGVVFLGPGLWALARHGGERAFLEQAGIACAAAGVAMISAGVGLATEQLWVAALASAVLLGVIVEVGRSPVLQFLAAALAVALGVLTLMVEELPFYVALISLSVPLGVLLLLRPPRIDLRPTAVVLLLALPVPGLLDGAAHRAELATQGEWVARIVCIATLVWVIGLLRRHASDQTARRAYLLLGLAAVALGALLPPGGTATLVILPTAYALGHPALAVVGGLLFVAFVWELYYDLETTLLAKSLILMGAGTLLVLVWWIIERALAPADR